MPSFILATDHPIRQPAMAHPSTGPDDERAQKGCPPCNQNCNQRRTCPAREVAGEHRSHISTPIAHVALAFCGWMWAEHKPTLLTAGATFIGVIGFAVWVRWPLVGA